jgi:electron transfer flavoprotein beta subunit
VRIAAVVEQGWDPASIEVDPAGRIDWSRAAPAASPGSLESVELGLQLGAVTVYGLGDAGPILRQALAMGCADARLAEGVEALAVALAGERPDLVLCPARSADHGPGLLAPALAGLLDLPQATAVESLRVSGGEVEVRRRLDRGEREDLALELPAVVALEPGMVKPRLAAPGALLAAQAVTLPTLTGERDGAPRAVLAATQPPRPPPPWVLPPDPSLPADGRVAAVLGAGAVAQERALVSGPVEELAERVVALLEERGFLAPATTRSIPKGASVRSRRQPRRQPS